MGDRRRTPSPARFCCIVVDRVLTCREGGPERLESSLRLSVLVDRSLDKIVQIQEGVMAAAEDTEILVCPLDSTLMPGFIDCHVHLTIATDDYQLDHMRLSSADKSLRALKAAQGLLRAGFTTVRSAGDADAYFPSFAVARSIRGKDYIGPRIVGAGHYISVTGGGGDINFLAPDNCLCSRADGVIADGREEMVKAVRHEIKHGSDWIKLLVTGAFMTAGTNAADSPENTHFSWDEMLACVEEGARRKVPVMAHAHGAEGIALAAAAGCRSIEHASFIDDRGIDACLEHDTWIVPTFSVGCYFDNIGSATGAQDRMIAIQKETNQRYIACIRNAVRRGVKVALGSDFVGWDPGITAREFRYLVELGNLSPLQAVLAGTRVAAELLGYSDLGKVEVGARADLVVVNGDPLKNISLLETGIHCVVKGGSVVHL